MKIIHHLYEKDVLEEELILNWFNQPCSLPDNEIEDQERLRSQKAVISYINWFNEAEEEA